MQAVILAGGQGTRLRPLTLSVAKPVMPLAGRPFMTFMLDWLRGHGVDDVVFCCGFQAAGVRASLGDRYKDVRLRYVLEDRPLGTAGPIRLAADEGMLSERFFVLNGDVLTDLDLTAELRQHRATRALATLALIAVDDTASYGVVPTRADGRVEAFLEKSSSPAPTNRINAGAYVLDREAVGQIPAGRPVSIEREVFPQLVGRGLYGYHADAYWIDIGTPDRYLEATYDLVSGRVPADVPAADDGSLVYEGSRRAGAVVTPPSVIGPRCTMMPGSIIDRAVLHADVFVGHACHIRESVLAEGVIVEDGARVGAGALVGSGARIRAGADVPAGARIDPGAVYGDVAAPPRRRKIAFVDGAAHGQAAARL